MRLALIRFILVEKLCLTLQAWMICKTLLFEMKIIALGVQREWDLADKGPRHNLFLWKRTCRGYLALNDRDKKLDGDSVGS
jgi:hypothetical protein